MERFWRGVGVTLGKYWWLVGIVVLVVTGALGFGIQKLEFATGQDSYLNPESQIARDNVVFQDQFGGENVIMLLTAEEGSDALIEDLFLGENLKTLERLDAELAEVEGVYSVVSPLTAIEFSDKLLSGENAAAQNALVSAASRAAEIGDQEGAEIRNADLGVSLTRRSAIPEDERVIGSPTYNELLLFDNTNYSEDGEAPADPLDRRIRKSLAGSFPGEGTDKEQLVAVGGVVLKGNASLDEQTIATEGVLKVYEDAEFDGFDLVVTGSPVYLAEINDYLQGGMLTLGASALVVMAVVLVLMFRVRWRLLPLLAVLVGVVWAFAVIGLIGVDLSLVTISGLPILIGLGIDFAIQIHNRVEEEVVLDHAEHPIAETVANIAPPLIVATITGVVAFLALQISKVPMIRDFGVLLAVGIVVLVIVGIVVPTAALGIREYKVPTKRRGASVVERIVVWLGGLPEKTGPVLIVLSAALFVGGIFAEGSAKIQSDPLKWIDQDAQVVKDIETLEDVTGFSSTMGILVEANNVFDDDVVQVLHEFTLDAESNPLVVSTSSLVNTIGKVIDVDGAELLAPTSADVVATAKEMPDAVARALVGPDADLDLVDATQVNLRLAPQSLEERADFVEELEKDLQSRIDALDLPEDSILLIDLATDQDPVRATPAGLAVVGVGLLENLSANRANLTYLALCLAGIWLVIRLRSVSRAVLALVPVLLAVGLTSLIVGLSGIELSPMTTVSGPLVIATCGEFSVLILGRYLEERQRGLDPREASDQAARRTGRAFFTSAATTIGGFAVLIGSALPLLRDFGILVTINVGIALLAALVVMPPLSVWVDGRRLLGTQEQGVTDQSVRMSSPFPGGQTVGMVIGIVLFAAAGVVVYATADTETAEAQDIEYVAAPLPTTTTTTTTTTVPPEGGGIDPENFGTERPGSLVGGVLFDLLTGVGEAPNVANCTVETLASRISDDELLAMGIAEGNPEAVALVVTAARDCGISDEVIQQGLTEFTGAPVELPPAEESGGGSEGAAVDPNDFGTERPASLVGGVLFDLLIDVGEEPNVANCTVETLASQISDEELLALGVTEAEPEAVAYVVDAAEDCGIEQATIDEALAAFSGG